ncbi:hypothetical protein Tco_1277288 [Tanacetum coccineum]
MDRFDVNRGSLLESKHGPKVPSVTLPPLPLVALCGIVVFLLSLSQYSNLQSWWVNIGISFQMLVLLTPFILMFFVSSSWITGAGWLSFASRKRKDSMNPSRASVGYGN